MPSSLFLQRGLFGFMDEQDTPRGLLGSFEDDPDRDRSKPGDVWDERTDYAQRQLDMALRRILTNPLGIQPITRNPLTGEINVVPYAKSVGGRYFDAFSKLPLPTGINPPGPTAPAPVTILSRPGLLFGVPLPDMAGQLQAEEVGSEVYHLPPEDDLGEDKKTGHRYVSDGSRYWYPETKRPGPLTQLYLRRVEEIRRRDPTNLKALENITDPTDSFRGGAYFERTLPEDTILYRVWGPAEGTKGGAYQFGNWWTKTPPKSAVQSTIDSAIKPEFGNTFRTNTSIRVPKGTTVYYGDVANQDALVDGGWQYYLPEVDPEWFIKARPFR